MSKDKRVVTLPSKKVLLLVSASVIVLIIGAYVAVSLLGWHRYQRTMVAQSSEWQQQIDTIVALEADNHEAVAKSISDYRYRIEATSCEPNVLISWQQQFISSWQSFVTDCQNDTLHFTSLSEKLGRIARYLEGRDSIVAVLAPVSRQPETQKADDWQASHTLWRSIMSDLDTIETTNDLEPLVTATKVTASGIVDAWKGLLDAHEDKNADAFRKGHENVDKAYKELPKLEAIDKRQLSQLLESFEAAYKERTATDKS